MQPKVYDFQEHKIAPEKIDSHAIYVIQKLRQAGFIAYLVGGGVRDLLLQQQPKDFDISTSAKPEEIKALFRNAILIGRRFRLAHIRFGKKVIEVATFRSGGTEEADLIVRDNVWGTEEQDVLRRDFTINGLFYDPANQTVIDYVNGYVDLQKGILRTIGQPDLRFMQDPVRMIRLIKFRARFDFTIDAPTLEALLNCKLEILKSSPVRVLEELLRMLESGAAKSFFHQMHEYGLLQKLLPELSSYFNNGFSSKTMQLLAVADDEIKKNVALDRPLLLSALVFPLFYDYVESKGQKYWHLGQIAEMAYDVIEYTFQPFFSLPRRIKGIMGQILTTQYRFIPIGKNFPRRLRIPKDPFFHSALHLLKLRSIAHPEILPFYVKWTEASFSQHTREERL